MTRTFQINPPTLRRRLLATSLTLAVAAALAGGATQALAHPPGPGAGHGPGMAAATPAERMAQAEQMRTARLAQLRSDLKLQPSQQAAFDGFEATIKRNAQAHQQQMDAMQKARGNPDAMADLRVTMLKARAQAADEANQARKALVAVLTPEQKATFDRIGPMSMAGRSMGPGMGPGMHEHRRGGPGCAMS